MELVSMGEARLVAAFCCSFSSVLCLGRQIVADPARNVKWYEWAVGDLSENLLEQSQLLKGY